MTSSGRRWSAIRARLRIKKKFKLLMGDGRDYNLLDSSVDEQTGMRMFRVKYGGGGFLIAIAAVVIGSLAGYTAYHEVGAFVGGFGGFVGTMALVVFLNLGSRMRTIPIPVGAVEMPNSDDMLSGKATVVYVPNYNRYGKRINKNSPLAIVMKESEDKDKLINYLTDEVKTLYYNLKRGQKTTEELTADLASALEKFGRAAAQFKPSYADKTQIVKPMISGVKEEELQ